MPPQFKLDLHYAYHQGLGLDRPGSGVTSDFLIPALFSLIPDIAQLQLIPSMPSYVGHGGTFSLLILWPEDVDVHVMTRSGRIARAALPITRPLDGTDSHEEVRRENDEILRQL
ncbi:hypothetical protein CK203_042655 [Vitis vinifera]|uniref:Uncharacterized protein n=1 Tax=Vitis vinifera TaxID=29760 RepID=A0A438I6T7_VITVI|nr:hypothetical protein CK203_042655 [Vitis vinifera]